MTPIRIWDHEQRCFRVAYALEFTGPHAEVSLLPDGPGEHQLRREHRDERFIFFGAKRTELLRRPEMVGKWCGPVDPRAQDWRRDRQVH
jgi:hypothetical protein